MQMGCHRDVTHWFVKARYEALSFALPGHLWFLELEVTKFGRGGGVAKGQRAGEAEDTMHAHLANGLSPL